MATRCNVKLTDYSGNTLWIYRHWDGYPAATGCHLSQVLKHKMGYSKGFSAFANALLEERYEQASCEPKPRPVYEITEMEHGDIEWLYVFNFKGRGKDATIEVEVHERSWSSGGKLWTKRQMTEEEFRAYCLADLKEMRKRIAAMKKKAA